MVQLAITVLLLIMGYLTGRYFEKRHYLSIFEREKTYQYMPVITGAWRSSLDENEEGKVLGAGTVIASDYFKSFVAGLKNLFGGRMNSYESLLDRGRREAILRVKEKARKIGAHKIINLRIETATIGEMTSRHKLPCVEIYAYGTAIKYKSKND